MQDNCNHKNGLEPFGKQWPQLSNATTPGIVDDFISLATRNSEADPAAVLATFLVRFGIEIGPGPFLMVGDTKHSPRLFAVIVGASAKSRKGTSSRPVEKLFSIDAHKFVKSLNSRDKNGLWIAADTTPGPLSSGEGLIWRVSNDNKNVNHDKRLFVMDEEFAAALKSTKREGNTLSTIARKFWDSGDVEPLTKNNQIRATGAHVGIVTHITMEELHKNFHSIEIYSGLANRFLWILAKRSRLVPNPVPMPDNELLKIQQKIYQILISYSKGAEICFTPNAKDMWKAIYPKLSGERPGLFGVAVNRAEAQTIRLAMIYALLDNKSDIDVPHLEAALAFWQYAEDSARYIFSTYDENTISKKIIDSLTTGPKTTAELHKAFGNNLKAKDMQAALEDLMERELVEHSQVASTGPKPINVYALRI